MIYLVCGEMFEQGKEVCDYLSLMCPVSYPILSPVHAFNDMAIVLRGSLMFPCSTLTQNPFQLAVTAHQVLVAVLVSF